MHISSDHLYRSDDLIWLCCVLFDRHVIRQLGHPFLSREARQEDVCVRQVQLAYSRIRKARFDLKAATLVLIEQGSKDRWGIEFWVTEKVNRSIHAYKRDGSHIADHAVVLNGLKTHI
jgi:hypothetical protein